MKNQGYATLIAAALVTQGLIGCSDKDGASNGGEKPAETQQDMAAALTSAGLKATATALADTGISGIFSGRSAYTVLAPADAAFNSLGEKGAELNAPEGRPARAAMLRELIIPGYVTAEDLSAAIDGAPKGQVTMRAMDGGQLTFSKSNNTIVVAGSDGRSAKLAGNSVKAGSSIALPINGILKPL